MIYTTGYSGKSADDLRALAERLDAIIVDIRLVPRSRWQKFWNKSALAAMFNERYVWVEDMGNLKFKEKKIEIKNLDAGIETVLAIENDGQYNLIILCGCSEYEHCHRKPVAEALRAKGRKVEELETWR